MEPEPVDPVSNDDDPPTRKHCNRRQLQSYEHVSEVDQPMYLDTYLHS